MSMLAEPRRKRDFTLIPKGKPLYEDENNFGVRMLQKMGWSQGKGLGAKEDGNENFIRVKYKKDVIGLGFEDRDDGWTQHKADFETLLNSLNNSLQNSDEENSPIAVGFGFQNGDSQKNEPVTQTLSGESLEEKSKKSRARVHYKKFTRGKDLSQYSEKDLANIFGKKNWTELQEEPKKVEEAEVNLDKEEHIFGVQTINTGTSINDYFKNKRALLTSGKKKIEATGEGQDCLEACDSEDRDLDAAKVGSKRKRKSDEETESAPNACQERTSDYSKFDEVPKTKHKKSKVNPDGNNEIIPGDDVVEEGDDQEIASKKKKKKRTLDEICPLESGERTSDFNEIVNNDETSKDTIKKSKKKKKSKGETTSQETEAEPVTTLEPFKNIDDSEGLLGKKSKKKKKNSSEFSIEPANVTEHSQDNETIQESGKKSKKVKKKIESDNSVEAEPSKLTEFTNERIKEKKSNKKENILDDPKISEATLSITKDTIPESKNCNLPSIENSTNVDKENKSVQVLGDDMALNESNVKQKKKRKVENSEPLPIPNSTINLVETATAEATRENSGESDKPKKHKKSKKKSAESQQDILKTENNESTTVSENAISTPPSCTYKMNSFYAEVFRHTDIGGFAGSNLSEIVGYNLTRDISLEVTTSSNDMQRITDMWHNAVHKYQQYQKKEQLKAESEQDPEKKMPVKRKMRLKNIIKRKKLFTVL